MNKTLTIVVPTYNMDRYLERCLSSLIISQEQMDKLEVLVINDGSKDHSSEIGHSFEKKYPQTFRVIDKENGNYGSCVNRGLKEATGKYIKILDADDWFDTKNFEKFVMLLSTIDVDCVISDRIKVDETGNQTEYYSFNFSQNKISTFEEIMSVPFKRFHMHCVAYNTNKVRSTGYHQTEGISYTDMEWIFLPVANCKSFYYTPETIYNYFIGRDGQTMNIDVYKKNFWQDILVQESMIEGYKTFTLNSSKAAEDYLICMLTSHSWFIYGHFFISFRMKICYNEMVEADKSLRIVLPSVAKELDQLYRFEPFNYHYVKKWREQNYPHQLLPLKWGLRLSDLKEWFKH